MNKIRIIFHKEMKEVLRDRKTLVFIIILPTVVIPLLLHLVFNYMQKKDREARTETLKIAIVHQERLPDLVRLFRDDEGFDLIEEPLAESDLRAAIKERKIKLGLVFPEDAEELIHGNFQLPITAYHNNASLTSKALPRVRTLLEKYGEKLQTHRLEALGLDNPLHQEGVITPTVLKEVGIADKREIIGEAAGGMLPYFFIVFCFLGSLYPAIDIGAGEKERGTLETLLLTPVPRVYLVLGKFFVVFTTGIVASLLCLVSIWVWITLEGKAAVGVMGEVISSVSPLDLALIGVLLLPMAAVFASLLLSVSIYAKNFKEANSYMAPLNLLCIFPAFIAMLPGVELTWKWAMVPVTNISLAIKELVKGTVDYNMIGVIFLSTAVFALLAFGFCVKWFQREQVLFRN